MIRFQFARAHPIAKTPWVKPIDDPEKDSTYKGRKYCGADGIITDPHKGYGHVQIKEHPSQLWMRRGLITELRINRFISMDCFGAPITDHGNLNDYLGAWCIKKFSTEFMLNLTSASPREIRVSFSADGTLSKDGFSDFPVGFILNLWEALKTGNLDLNEWEKPSFSQQGGKIEQFLAKNNSQ